MFILDGNYQLISFITIQQNSLHDNVISNSHAEAFHSNVTSSNRQISGFHKTVIKYLLWLNILLISFLKYKNPVIALKRLRSLSKIKDAYRGENKLLKYALAGKRYYFSYNAPGWPSRSFNKYIRHQLTQFDSNTNVSLHTLIFGVTKKCCFKCEHCFEWENLNKPETLSREDLAKVISGFRELGVSMVQITGGEPLNRLNDIIEIIPHFTDIDFWMYTSGFQLTNEKAVQLKKAGLTGVTISLDHCVPALHDEFRGKKGSYAWVEKAAKNTVANDLALCLSLCATKDFTTLDNLYNYLELAKNLRASFIQILEPKAVGHYAGKDVILAEEKTDLLNAFYQNINFNPYFKNYPSVVYHGFYSRRLGCSGAGKDYLYVDMNGFAHDCPFCHKKMFNVLQGDIKTGIETMRVSGCSVFNLHK